MRPAETPCRVLRPNVTEALRRPKNEFPRSRFRLVPTEGGGSTKQKKEARGAPSRKRGVAVGAARPLASRGRDLCRRAPSHRENEKEREGENLTDSPRVRLPNTPMWAQHKVATATAASSHSRTPVWRRLVSRFHWDSSWFFFVFFDTSLHRSIAACRPELKASNQRVVYRDKYKRNKWTR